MRSVTARPTRLVEPPSTPAPRRRRRRVAARMGAVVASGAALAAGALVLAPAGAVAAVPADVIPFTAATATAGSDGATHLVWAAPSSAGTVTVYASSSPAPETTGDVVGHGGSSGSVTVTGLAAPSPRWYFTLAPAHGQDLVVAVRSLGMAAAPNLRDVGDYRTTDGQWVRPGLVYRSNALSSLTAADQQELTDLGVSTVVDLRTTAEQGSAPDVLPSTITHVSANVFASDPGFETTVENDATELISDPTTTAVTAKQTTAAMVTMYKDMVTLPSARSAYHTLYTEIADLPSGSALDFHCTAGKDRAGWGTAALLLELGVPERTVMADYLLSNVYALHDLYGAILSSYESKGGKAAALVPILGAQRVLLQTSISTMDKRYGSINGYFTKGLGLSSATIAHLRSELLAGSPTT